MLKNPKISRITYSINEANCLIEMECGDTFEKKELHSFQECGKYIDELLREDNLVITSKTTIECQV